MGRSLKKGPYVDEGLLKKVKLMRAGGQQRKAIKTWARRATVVPEMVGQTFSVHNGNKFINVFATENMVGHRLGEFSPTRTFRGHREPRGADEPKAAAAS